MKRRSIRCMLLLTFFCVLMLQGTVAFAANKAAKISTVFSSTKEGGYPSYALSMDFKKTGKLAKKNTWNERGNDEWRMHDRCDQREERLQCLYGD